METQPKLTRVECARRGGKAISENRDHMRAIGSLGGQVVSQDREHMRAIGRRGGASSHKSARQQQQQDTEDAAPGRED